MKKEKKKKRKKADRKCRSKQWTGRQRKYAETEGRQKQWLKQRAGREGRLKTVDRQNKLIPKKEEEKKKKRADRKCRSKQWIGRQRKKAETEGR